MNNFIKNWKDAEYFWLPFRITYWFYTTILNRNIILRFTFGIKNQKFFVCIMDDESGKIHSCLYMEDTRQLENLISELSLYRDRLECFNIGPVKNDIKNL